MESRRIIKTDTIYNFLRDTFLFTYQELKDAGMVANNNIQFELYQDQADYDGKILIPTYADEDESKKKIMVSLDLLVEM